MHVCVALRTQPEDGAFNEDEFGEASDAERYMHEYLRRDLAQGRAAIICTRAGVRT